MTKKLIYICGNEDLKNKTILFLNANQDDLIIQDNFTVTLQPFGSVVKSMLLSAYKEDVQEIYLITSLNASPIMMGKEIRQWLIEKGIDPKTLKIFQYLDQFEHQPINEWLTVNNVEDTLSKNIDMLKAHPLLPKHLIFKGLVFDKDEHFHVVNG